MIAGLASFFCPGLGHLLCGKPFSGILWFCLVLIGYLLFLIPGILLHIMSIMASVDLANRIEWERRR